MWASLYTPIGSLKYEKLNYRIIRFSTLMDELIGQKFSGYVEILAPHEHGLIILYNGKVCNCFYEGTEELNLSREEVIGHFLRTETKERDSIINVGELAPRVIVALGALEARQPAHRELETIFLDMGRLFETLSRKHFTGVLRFYRIRNNTRLGNILLRLKKITADQLREAIRLQLSGEGALRLGEALVRSSAIGEKDLEDALDRQSNTRKGSDMELAIALFSEGEFLGGYRDVDKKNVTDRQEVISWLATSEVLMDIIDGILPPVIDITTILHPGKAVKPARSAVSGPEKSKPEVKSTTHKAETTKEAIVAGEAKEKTALEDAAIQELTKEIFMLKADDLILDIHTHPTAPAMGDDEAAADADLQWLDKIVEGKNEKAAEKKIEAKQPSSENKPDKITKNIISDEKTPDQREEKSGTLPEKTVTRPEKSPASKSTSAESKTEAADSDEPVISAAGASSDSQVLGIEAMEKVLKQYMGFLGIALLEREKQHFAITEIRNVRISQLKSINQSLFHSTSLIVGNKTAEKIMLEIEDYIGG